MVECGGVGGVVGLLGEVVGPGAVGGGDGFEGWVVWCGVVVGVGEVGGEDAPGDGVDDEVVGEEEESSGGGGSEGEVDGLEHDAVGGVEAGLGGGLVFCDGGGDVGVVGEVGVVEQVCGVDAAGRRYPQLAFTLCAVEGEAEDVVVVDDGLQGGGKTLWVEVGGDGEQD
ncbi:hypothetical protein SVIO_088080 [Streptomyces violaceusniger]|uniref:Uncharacterized protein n=1 Tax=Streptomyces violaceusniger TaxID=68280 RepID=A0A4D4LAN9_STRVO|nr:hypothetical protein SVIO_088080 [Streptomyces violaceusniger]